MDGKLTNYDWIRKNRKLVNKLYRAGYVSSTALLHCKLYEDFEGSKQKEIMMKYQEVADKNNVSLSTVIKAIKRMRQ